ncbi:hypothetical protein FSP39_000341 [Pinctada imbricata]|uniref:Calpain catalytic domain-containing protein n=1 Tax=Pinctada imbricata TaxID=66713 RepID=A0AA89CDN2_PINIB|nr:hypothetical protein FSP39_000341 [Pinctada imbricata]
MFIPQMTRRSRLTGANNIQRWGVGPSSDTHSGPEYGQYSTFGYNGNVTQNNTKTEDNKKAAAPTDETIYGENIDFTDDQKRLEELKRQQDAQDDNARAQDKDDRPHDAAIAAALIARQQQEEEERKREEEERRRKEQERIEAENKKREEEQALEDEQANQEEERKRQEEEDQRQREQAALAATAAAEEEKLRQEEEEKRRQEEEQNRLEEEKRKQEEEQKQQEEEEQRSETGSQAAIALISAKEDSQIEEFEIEAFETPKPPEFGTDYIKNDLGVHEKHVDLREVAEEPEFEQEPEPNDGGLYTDRDFTLQDAVPGKAGQLEWKRPTEIRDNPVLFSEGTTRFDVGQGSFGTCWFLSMVSVIADKPKLMARVIPRDAYKVGTKDYHGIFHCRFGGLVFGTMSLLMIICQSFMEVSTMEQDHPLMKTKPGRHCWKRVLPVSKSRRQGQIMRIPIGKVAIPGMDNIPRMYGNYNSVQGGLVQDSYLNLTGGVAEMIKNEDVRSGKGMTEEELFYRLRNALHSGAVACCDVPTKYDDTHGLVGGHAYSMTDSLEINGQKLVRIRNPWGKTEWTGPWSDGSPEWQSIQGQVQAPNKDDGEFYMSFEHFLTYFDSVTICYVASIYGQWKGEEAAGFQKKIQNPKYSFRVGNDCADREGKVPIVVQIIQRTKKRKANHPSIRCDLYKVLNRDSNDQIVVMALGKDRTTYRSDMQVCYRFQVSPGEYCAVPSTIEGGIEKEFMIRVFTSGPISDIRHIDSDLTIQELTDSPDPCLGTILPGRKCSQCLVGQWISGQNAGGQVSRQTFHTNPQFHIDVPNHGGDVRVSFILSQEATEPRYPIGFKLFARDGSSIPVSQEWLYEHWDSPIKTTEGDESVFIIANCAPEQKYRLPPGEYLAIIHADSEDQEKKFALTVFSDKRIDVT